MDPFFRLSLGLMERKRVGKDPDAVARYEVSQRARRAFASAAAEFPPTNLEKIAESLGVKSVRYVPLLLDGRLLSEGRSYVIEVNSKAPAARRRFTLAHEIGHLLVGGQSALRCTTASGKGNSPKRDAQEERLCDCAASELLIPYDWAWQFLMSRAPGYLAISEMAALCRVSLEVAARRLVETGVWQCRLVWWSRDGDSWRAVRSFPAYDYATLLTIELPDGERSIVNRVFKQRRELAGTQSLRIQDGLHTYRMEAWPAARNSVASLMILEHIAPARRAQPSLFDS